MKLHIKNKGIFSLAVAASMSLTACVGDLDVTPIDPNLSTPDKVLTDAQAYNRLLAKCYSGLSVSGSEGNNSDINGIDAGFGQYFRGLFNCQELPTDEAVMGWNDQTIKDLHGLQWGASDVFVNAMFYRITQQISVCNEVMRKLAEAGNKLDDATRKQYIAEARALRDLSYLHGIDLFGNMPFKTEKEGLTSTPTMKTRAELYTWLEEDLTALADELPANPEKYRAGKGMVYMMLAKLYLNAKVYTGTAAYDKCAEACKKVIDLGYKLEAADEYKNLFGAENDQYLGVGHEIIFAVYQDHIHTQAYGSTTYIVNSSTGGSMDPKTLRGINGDGWGGIRVTPEFVDKFNSSDIRSKFYTDGQTKEITAIGTFSSGYGFTKFHNLKKDGTMIADANAFCDTDFPLYRLSDVYLMLAECQVVGGVSVNVNGKDGVALFNEVRQRAGIDALTTVSAQNIIDERARELAWECHRRSDLIRFGLFTTSNYLWSYKGMNSDTGAPHSVDSKYNLFPLPAKEVASNNNLKQNTGY